MSFIASVFSIVWLINNWKYILIGLIALIILYYAVKAHKAQKAKLAQEAMKSEQAKKTQELLDQIAQDNKRMEESAARAQQNYDRIEAAITANPLSAKYRRDTQQQSASFNFVEVDKFVTMAKKSFIAVDLETTGLNVQDDEIIELSAVKVVNGQITETFSQLIDPQMPIPQAASAVNHITDAMVSGKPRIYEIIPNFLEFVGNEVLVAHNAKFDAEFMAFACMRYRFKVYRKWFDSMELKAYWPGLKNRKLQTFLDAAGIVNNEAHRAESDAEALAKLVIKTLEKIDSIT